MDHEPGVDGAVYCMLIQAELINWQNSFLSIHRMEKRK